MNDLLTIARLHKLEQAAALTKQRRRAAQPDTLKQFRVLYRNDPGAFIYDCFRWDENKTPADYQLEIAYDLARHKREAVRGCHGLGKTAIAAWITLWFALTRDGDSDWKAPTTASNWRQLTKYLWPEIHKWARRIRWDIVGRAPFDERLELQTLNLKLSTGEAFAVASDNAGYIEGAHADSILYIFDEAKLIPSATFDAAEGAFSGAGANALNEAFALAISTPGETVGRFYDIHQRRPGLLDWKTRHVTIQEAIAAGRVGLEWVENRRAQWGETSAIYQNRVLGEFADSAENALIPLSWVEKAHNRYANVIDSVTDETPRAYGLDVARYGEDKTALAELAANILIQITYWAKQSTMITTGAVAARLGLDTESPIAIDTIGVGAGVFDRLEELGYNVESVNVAERTDLTDSTGENSFPNLRSAILWAVREALDPDNIAPLALPDDDILTGDLTAPTWKHTSRGQIVIETKEETKKKIERSPDALDALALAIYAQTPRIWAGVW